MARGVCDHACIRNAQSPCYQGTRLEKDLNAEILGTIGPGIVFPLLLALLSNNIYICNALYVKHEAVWDSLRSNNSRNSSYGVTKH